MDRVLKLRVEAINYGHFVVGEEQHRWQLFGLKIRLILDKYKCDARFPFRPDPDNSKAMDDLETG